jgi:hypothetical protein
MEIDRTVEFSAVDNASRAPDHQAQSPVAAEPAFHPRHNGLPLRSADQLYRDGFVVVRRPASRNARTSSSSTRAATR